MVSTAEDSRWRAVGPYRGTNASKAGLLEETRQFLLTYAHLRDLAATRRALLAEGLPQRARATRETIVLLIQQRLARWHPPAWVWGDLITFAQNESRESLQAALLLHVVRQDTLLYDLVQHLITPHWVGGEHQLIRADVQRFLDAQQPTHPEITRWSHATREKLAGNLLTILRDYGLLQGTAQKHLVEPVVPLPVAQHLVRLLRAEGIAPAALAAHPDWRIWLWDAGRAQAAVEATLHQTAAA